MNTLEKSETHEAETPEYPAICILAFIHPCNATDMHWDFLFLGAKFSQIILGIVLWDRDKAEGRDSMNPDIQQKDFCVFAFYSWVTSYHKLSNLQHSVSSLPPVHGCWENSAPCDYRTKLSAPGTSRCACPMALPTAWQLLLQGQPESICCCWFKSIWLLLFLL